MLSSASKCPGVTDCSDVLPGVLIVVLIYNRTPFHFGVCLNSAEMQTRLWCVKLVLSPQKSLVHKILDRILDMFLSLKLKFICTKRLAADWEMKWNCRQKKKIVDFAPQEVCFHSVISEFSLRKLSNAPLGSEKVSGMLSIMEVVQQLASGLLLGRSSGNLNVTGCQKERTATCSCHLLLGC